jgi:hypothetical protein
VLTLPFSLFPSPISGGHFVNQVWELHFGYVPSLARNRKLALKKGDLSSHLISLSAQAVQAPTMTAVTYTRVTFSQSSATSAVSRAKCYTKKKDQEREDVRETRKD